MRFASPWGHAAQWRTWATASVVIVLSFVAPPAAASMAHLSLEGMSAEEREVVLASQVGQRLRLTFSDGTQPVGQLIAALPGALFLAVEGAKTAIELASDTLVSFTRLPPREAPTLERSGRSRFLGLQEVTLLNGRTVVGVLVSVTPTVVTLVSASKDRISLPRERIAGIAPVGTSAAAGRRLGQESVGSGAWAPSAPEDEPHSASRYHRARYFVLRSAKPLGEWEGYVSQKELGYTEFSLGVSDHFSIYAGAVIPAWFMGGIGGLHIVLGAYGGLEVAPDLYWSGSLHGALLPEPLPGGAAVNFGSTLTWGPDALNVSLGVLVPLVFAQEAFEAEAIVTIAASMEVTDWLALMTEHSISPTLLPDGVPMSLHMAGWRVMFRHWSFDLAVAYSPFFRDFTPVLPFLDVTYRWGTPAASDAPPLDEQEAR
jgi:hypothetical protein